MQFSTFGRVPPVLRGLLAMASGSDVEVARGYGCPIPQDPTACLGALPSPGPFHSGKPVVLGPGELEAPHVNVPPLSYPSPNSRR